LNLEELQMRRRDFIAGLGGAMAWPLAARAQQRALPVIGFLSDGSLETRRDYLAVFLRGLAETGYVEGRNITIEYRWTENRGDRLPALAADLVRRQVAVIATPAGSTASALAAKAATQSIPIVFITGSDPVQIGLIGSVNRPGGNATGVMVLGAELAAKRLELLHQSVPAATLVAHLINPFNQVFADFESSAAQAAARALGVRLLTLKAREPHEIDTAFESLIRQQVGALMVSSDTFFLMSQRDQLVALAARHRVPAIYGRREGAAAGGLMSYGVDFADALRQAGVYTGRILNGEKPADLPVQQATKIELVINLKTAKALGITFPTALLVRADEVIE
jgi:putative tryptophan/tyrosine transport system substrate-binding protein